MGKRRQVIFANGTTLGQSWEIENGIVQATGPASLAGVKGIKWVAQRMRKNC